MLRALKMSLAMLLSQSAVEVYGYVTQCKADTVIPVIFLFFLPQAKAAAPAIVQGKYHFVSSLDVEDKTFWARRVILDTSFEIFKWQIGENLLAASPVSHNGYEKMAVCFSPFHC